MRLLQRNYKAQVALCGIDVQKSLVDNHVVGVVDVDVDGLSRVTTDRDTRLIKWVWPTP